MIRVREKSITRITIILLATTLLMATGVAYAKGPPIQPRDMDYIYVQHSEGQEFIEVGPYICTSIRVYVDDTSPDNTYETVNIIDYSNPWVTYYTGNVKEGKNTGWVSFGGDVRWVYVQFWYHSSSYSSCRIEHLYNP